LTPHWRGTLAASRVDARYSETFKSGATTIASGNKLPGIPQHFVFSELLWSSQAAKGSLTAYARVDNLTDKRYVGSVIVNQAASQFYEPAPGRNWTLGLRVVLPL